MNLPLEGIKVLDFTQFQQGPYATLLLADMGAEVWKVEKPGSGDLGRGIGSTNAPPEIYANYFFTFNRNKKSVVVDIKKPLGKEVVYRLAEKADVCVNNFRPGVMESLGFGYEDLARRNSRLIYAAASGFGPKGPKRARPVTDLAAQAMGGLMSITGEVEGYPLSVGSCIADQMGATSLAWGIVTALFVRERTGIGQQVEGSLLGGQIVLQAWEFSQYLRTRELKTKAGRHHPLIPGIYGSFKAKDRYFVIAGVKEEHWHDFCRLLDIPHLVEDPRFDSSEKRRQNHEELIAILDPIFATKEIKEWLEILVSLEIICAPVNTYKEVAEEPQVLENEYICNIPHPELGEVQVIGLPIKFSKTPGLVQGLAPALGQHTREVLLQAGYGEEEIAELRRQKVIP